MSKKKSANSRLRSKNSRAKAAKTHPLKKASRLFLPYPLFLFVMLVVGAMLSYSTFSAGAIDYLVKAKVPAPPLTEPAVITSPVGGDIFSEVPITVDGTCPLDSYVEIYRNNFFSGSVLCSSDQKFSIDIDLFEGANELNAKVFNLTDDEGPSSTPVTVYYSPPEPEEPTPGTRGGSSRPGGSIKAPFVIKSDFKLKGYFVGERVNWKVELSGGSPPYAVNVEWGDGSSSLISQKDEGSLTLEHIYHQPGGEKGNYRIKIRASDSAGRKAYLEMFLIINRRDVPAPLLGSSGDDSPGAFIGREFLKFLWPAYGVVALMALSFWLGEREELLILGRQTAKRRRRS